MTQMKILLSGVASAARKQIHHSLPKVGLTKPHYTFKSTKSLGMIMS
jgi:hypothetical protein